jgi:outer membrane protein OmpA-like peptidoglycan-associated protein
MRPHDAAPGRRGFAAASPWADADALVVRTGDLSRAGFAGAVGLAIPLDQQRKFWVGPYVRYFQIVQGERAGFDTRDAKLLTVGLSLEVGTGLTRPHRVVAVVASPVGPAVASQGPDRDHDGVSDEDDRCPDLVGLASNRGCPTPDAAAAPPVTPEVRQKIAFEWDSARLSADSYPALDDVVRALEGNPAFRLEVEGHASSEGTDDHNQQLSEQRASVVRRYLSAHGIAGDRLISRGLSSSAPIASNETLVGRQTNRRVEFSLHLIIVNVGSQP